MRAFHGMHGSPEYRVWGRMIGRCHRPKDAGYHRYGGRGITVCPEWRGPGGFQLFFAHVGARPSPDHSIDRIDNNGNYEPGNVRWVTWREQCLNTRQNHQITIDGTQKPLTVWAEEFGIEPGTIFGRIARGWDPADAVQRPASKRPKTQTRLVTIDGVTASIGEWCRKLGVNRSTVGNRIAAGIAPEIALIMAHGASRKQHQLETRRDADGVAALLDDSAPVTSSDRDSRPVAAE